MDVQWCQNGNISLFPVTVLQINNEVPTNRIVAVVIGGDLGLHK